MSAIATHDFVVAGSDCLRLAIRLAGPDETPVDLTGFTAELELRFGGESMVITEPELEIAAAEGGIETVLQSVLVATLPLGRLTRHRWTLIEPGGCRRSVLEGYIERI